MSKYRVLPAELKAKVALAAMREDRTVYQIASEYQVQPAQVSQWRRRLRTHVHEIFRDGRAKGHMDQMRLIEQVCRQIKQLEFQLAQIQSRGDSN